jgi:hypothetical protein
MIARAVEIDANAYVGICQPTNIEETRMKGMNIETNAAKGYLYSITFSAT